MKQVLLSDKRKYSYLQPDLQHNVDTFLSQSTNSTNNQPKNSYAANQVITWKLINQISTWHRFEGPLSKHLVSSLLSAFIETKF